MEAKFASLVRFLKYRRGKFKKMWIQLLYLLHTSYFLHVSVKVLWFQMHDLLNKPNNTSNVLSYLSKQYLSMHLHWWLLCPPRKFLWNAIYQKLDNKSICLYNVCIVDCWKFLWQIKILHEQKTFEWNKEWVGLFLLCSTSYPCGKMILIILLWTRY